MIVDLFVRAELGGDGLWHMDPDTAYIEILSDIFSVQINDIFDVIDAEGVDGKIIKAADVLFGEYEFSRYLSDIDYIREKGIFNALLDEKVANFVRGVVGDDRIEYLKGLFGNVYIGEIVDLLVTARLDGKDWYQENGEVYYALLSDIFSVQISKIFEIIDSDGSVTDKILDAVEAVFGKGEEDGKDFRRYLGFIDYLEEKDFFNALLAEKVYDFVDGVIGDDRIEYLKGLFGDAAI